MDRQFQNFSTTIDPFSRNMAARPGGAGVSYIDRPQGSANAQLFELEGQRIPLNQSQYDYNRNQDLSSMTTPSMSNMKPVYNPNIMSNKPNFLEQARQSMPGTSLQTKEKELGILFYSNNCSHSKLFLAQLYKSPINDSVKKICVDKDNVKIPSFVSSVPTLIARGINKPLVGDQTNAWLENICNSYRNMGSSQGPKTQTQESDLLSYCFNTKDNYSFIGDTDELSVCNSLADWDKDYYINAPLDSDQKEKKSSNINGATNIKQTIDVSRMRIERDSMLGQTQPPKNPVMDPEKFNKMFLKQQQQSFKQNIRNI